jgi:SNF2 family DNA or RNA helicase
LTSFLALDPVEKQTIALAALLPALQVDPLRSLMNALHSNEFSSKARQRPVLQALLRSVPHDQNPARLSLQWEEEALTMVLENGSLARWSKQLRANSMYAFERNAHYVLLKCMALMGSGVAELSSFSQTAQMWNGQAQNLSLILSHLPRHPRSVLYARLHVDLHYFFRIQEMQGALDDFSLSADECWHWMNSIGARLQDLYPSYRTKFLFAVSILTLMTERELPSALESLPWLQCASRASLHLFEGELEAALDGYLMSTKLLREHEQTSVLYEPHHELYLLALLAKNDVSSWKSLNRLLKSKQAVETAELELVRGAALSMLNHGSPPSPSGSKRMRAALPQLIKALLSRWHGRAPETGNDLASLKARASAQGYTRYAKSLTAILNNENLGLMRLRQTTSRWQELLSLLDQSTGGGKAKTVRAQSVLVVLIKQLARGGLSYQLAEAKDHADAELKRLHTRVALRSALKRVSEQKAIRLVSLAVADDHYEQDYSWTGVETAITKRGFWEELEDYPHVYFEPEVKTEEVTFKTIGFEIPKLIEWSKIKESKKHCRVFKSGVQVSAHPDAERADHQRLQLDPPITSLSATLGYCWRPGELAYVDLTPSQMRISALVRDGISVPATEVIRLAELAHKSPLLRLSLAPSQTLAGKASSAIHVLLEPTTGGLRASTCVRPFGVDQGPYFEPGIGEVLVVSAHFGQLQQIERDLNAERQALQSLLAQSSNLAESLERGKSEGEQALELIEQLQSLTSPPILAWPKSKAQRILKSGQLRLRRESGRDWLGLNGELEVDDQSVALADLLRLMQSSRSRFVRLDEERVLKLDQKLRKQLEAIQSFADKKQRVEVPMLAGVLLADGLGLSDGEHEDALKSARRKMSEAFALTPKLPATFQAELRDYQLEGYQWLMRMAAWGAGACLADDMGLGKTIQALALLVARAPLGPALVVAPTSVVANWAREANRFAPTLRLHRFDAMDRSEELTDLASFDVLLVSYGLLTLNEGKFSKVVFTTVVLDEAQAIKNAQTQRAQAVQSLQTEFRLALSGTPLENHLQELWSLMRFLNPGLLGSQAQFQERFVQAIERDPQSETRKVLRQLIHAFVLRRTKAQVLTELPEKTEITLSIEPSEGERALHRSLRLAAIQTLREDGGASPDRRFHVLAEIMRLRRAACHPDLAAPELKLASAKLEALMELLAELRDNQHRALIFSQFTDCLALVRARLDAGGISYQYLDGSSSSKSREAAVDAFQAGVGDAFLLSLKAGGVGLNLTAADYVIHLDPWWNPAVEQQASDRAHRIGQTRPVTIYRLVLAGSIEEQIMGLHGQKRELFESMLGEANAQTPLNADELIALIAGEA